MWKWVVGGLVFAAVSLIVLGWYSGEFLHPGLVRGRVSG